MKELGSQAPDFQLLDVVTGREMSRANVAGPKGMLAMFICRHCPFVKHVENELAKIGRDYAGRGVGIVAISSNDVTSHPEDSPTKLAYQAQELTLNFPYLFDESQDVARAYDAQCTPDFFGFNAKLELQYRGRLDASRTSPVPNARRDLFEAMLAVARTGEGPKDQIASIGCSIKWRR